MSHLNQSTSTTIITSPPPLFREENLGLQEELTKAENSLINRDNECMALKERIQQQLSDLHASRKRVQDLIQRNDQLNHKLSEDIAALALMVDQQQQVQVNGLRDVTLYLPAIQLFNVIYFNYLS